MNFFSLYHDDFHQKKMLFTYKKYQIVYILFFFNHQSHEKNFFFISTKKNHIHSEYLYSKCRYPHSVASFNDIFLACLTHLTPSLYEVRKTCKTANFYFSPLSHVWPCSQQRFLKIRKRIHSHLVSVRLCRERARVTEGPFCAPARR